MKCKWSLSRDANYNLQSSCGNHINSDSIGRFKKFKYCPFCGCESEYKEIGLDASELSDGNIIICNGAIYEVNYNREIYLDNDTDKLEPLHITKQIFKKIGVEKVGDIAIEYKSHSGVGYIHLYIEIDGCVGDICNIYTVHEFQNWYRIVTGNKLNVKL